MAEKALRTAANRVDGLPAPPTLTHTRMLCALENAIEAATETHLRTKCPEVSCRTLRRVQACEAQALQETGQMESAGTSNAGRLRFILRCCVLTYDMRCGSECESNMKSGNDATRQASEDAVRWGAQTTRDPFQNAGGGREAAEYNQGTDRKLRRARPEK